MSELVENIWKSSAQKANNPSRPVKVANWTGSKWRKVKKPRNVIKTGTTVATAFVPLAAPLWTSGVDYVVNKVEGKIRSHYHNNKDVDPTSVIKSVKHGIKALDVSKLDQSRYKVQHGWEKLDRYFRENDRSLSKCVGTYGYALHYHYMRRRTAKLRFQAQVMRDLSDSILDWCDTIEKKLSTLEGPVKQGLEDRLDHEPRECGGVGSSSGCFNAEGNDSKLAASVSKLVALP